MYDIQFSNRGKRDYKIAIKSEYINKIDALIGLIKEDPLFSHRILSQYLARIHTQDALTFNIDWFTKCMRKKKQ